MDRQATQTLDRQKVADCGHEGGKSKLKARAIDGVKKFAIITLYLWVLFALFSLHKTLILEHEHLNYGEQGFAIVNALIFAKVMLVAQDLKLGSRFQHQPLIESVLWYAASFAVVLFCFHIAEGALSAWLHGKSPSDSLHEYGNGAVWSDLAVCAMFFVLLIPYFMFAELGRVLGRDKLWRLLLTHARKTISIEILE